MNRIVYVIVSVGAAIALAVTLWMALAFRLPGDVPPEQPSPAVQPIPTAQPVPAAKGDVRLIAFEDLKFKEPAVRDRLLKLQAAARTIATPQWQHVPWHWQGAAGGDPPTAVIFATQWCSRPSGKPYCLCSRPSHPCHKIDLSAVPLEMKVGQPKEIFQWTLLAQDYPAEDGWGVRLYYTEGWFDGAVPGESHG